MNFPEVVLGVWSSYCGSETSARVPLCDIYSFELYHEYGRNGLQIRANIKADLVDFFDYSKETLSADEKKYLPKREGRYRKHQSSFIIRAKDNPKFRKELFEELQKQPLISKRIGFGAGTPLARSVEFNKKEIILGVSK